VIHTNIQEWKIRESVGTHEATKAIRNYGTKLSSEADQQIGAESLRYNKIMLTADKKIQRENSWSLQGEPESTVPVASCQVNNSPIQYIRISLRSS
jgi:hypothetical protein